MNKSVRIFPTPYELAENFAEYVVNLIEVTQKERTPICIALSGGSTPELFYSVLGDHFSKTINWGNIHFFWGDERCVAPDERESNYGMARRSLLAKISIPESNIHRIKGENDPDEEAKRYAAEIQEFTRRRENLPVFDLVILGLGEDGHTASIFPSTEKSAESELVCEVASHPVTKQKRITLTIRIINNADRVAFLVTGRKKAAIVRNIINENFLADNFPASMVVPKQGEVLWFLDQEAASYL